jgi:putative CocE/NonD family hydrolase
MRFRQACALAVLALAAAVLVGAPASAQAPAAGFGSYAPPVDYPERITTSLYLPMRDGVKLAVSVTRPARGGKPVEGRFPVVWQHTLGIAGAGAQGGPLGQGAKVRGYGAMSTLANYGYVVVQVARRGNGPSFGQRRGYNDRSEAYDAYEVIDWLASQPWSTGNVGVYGCSNTGDAAMHAVTAGNPHLKAAWAGCFNWEKYDGFLRGGILANWGTGPQRTVAEDMTNVPVQGDDDKHLLREAAEAHLASTPLLELWKGMPYRDSTSPLVQTRFWIEGSSGRYAPQIARSGVAIYIQGGWYDDFRQQGLIAYANLTGEKHVVIGPWMHCANDDFDLLAEIHRFFDQHLKGVDTGMLRDDPIHYFTVNAPAGREWRSTKQWPVAGARNRDLHLIGAALTAAPPSAAKPTAFTVRYDVACPPGQTQPPLNDLLTGALPCFPESAGPHFTGPVLGADVEVTGSPVAQLWITSSAADQNLFAYLEDVAPDGQVTKVTEGRLKASLRKLDTAPFADYGLPWHRSFQEDAQALKRGEPALLAFDLLPASYIFKTGHRMPVTVTGADYREKISAAVSPAPTLTLLGDADHDSRIGLPIVDASGQ